MTAKIAVEGPDGARMTLDLDRPPNPKELRRLQRRQHRLAAANESTCDAVDAVRRLDKAGHIDDVRIRSSFIRLASPAPRDSSDRSAPKPEHRPPATRLMSPNGIALPFYLTSLYEAQCRTTPGHRPTGNETPLRGAGGTPGWTSYIATPAKPSGDAKHRMSVLDKKLRQLCTTIERLNKERLVDLPNADKKTGQCEGFLLMNEGARPGRPNDLYTVPTEDFFTVPATLFTNGWIFVLEDSEIAMLLLAARAFHKRGDTSFQLSATTRIMHYGIGRDAFEAHTMLDRLGLLEVIPDSRRRSDGKSTEYEKKGAQPHELRFLPHGLQNDAAATLASELDHQILRGRD